MLVCYNVIINLYHYSCCAWFLLAGHNLADHMRDVYRNHKHTRYLFEKEKWPPTSLDVVVNVAMITHREKQTEKQFIKIAERHKEGTSAVDKIVTESEEIIPAKKQRLSSWVTREVSDVFAAYPAEKEAKSPKRILIEGAPGIGKTVLAKDIAYRWSTGEILQDVMILFLLFLRDPKLQTIKSPAQLVEYVGMGYFDDDKLSKFSKQLDDTKEVCFLLDGFDEYPDAQNERSFFIDLIYRCVFPNATVVITSRPNCTFKLHEQMDKRIEILGLAKRERDQLISHLLCNEDDKSNLEKYLKHQPIINGFCYVPLYLTILLYIFQQGYLPKSLTEMNRCFILHEVYRHLKGLELISPEVVVTKLEDLKPFYPDYMSKLSLLAYKGLERDKLIFTANELDFSIVEHTAQNGFGLLQVVEHYPATGAGKVTSFNFLHFTIQEFLAANYVSTLPHHDQLNKMKKTFWEHRYSYMWMVYVGIVGIYNTVFIEFIGKGKLYKTKGGPKIVGFDKKKRLQLFQCYMEAKCNIEDMPRTISSMFDNGEVDFANITLLPHHVSYLTSFMSSVNVKKEWTKLNLSNSNLDDSAMNILELFIVDYAQKAASFKWVDASDNLSTPWSVYSAIISCCQVTKLTLLGDKKYRMEPYTAILKKSLESNNNLQELSLFGMSEKDLLSIKESMLCCSHSLCVLNLSFKKNADTVVIETFHNVKSEINERPITVKILDDKSYGTPQSKTMSSCNIGDLEITYIAFGLHHNQAVQCLDISNNNISKSGTVELCDALKENDTLNSLDISKNNLTCHGAKEVLESVQASKALYKLNISEVGISQPDDNVEEAISNLLKGNKTLHFLNLSKNAISIQGSKKIAVSCDAYTRLRILDISLCNLSNDGVTALSSYLQENVFIEELYLSGNKVTNKGIEKIALFVKQNTSLKILDVSNNHINSDGLINFLRTTKKNSSLKMFYAKHNNVTKSRVMQGRRIWVGRVGKCLPNFAGEIHN